MWILICIKNRCTILKMSNIPISHTFHAISRSKMLLTSTFKTMNHKSYQVISCFKQYLRLKISKNFHLQGKNIKVQNYKSWIILGCMKLESTGMNWLMSGTILVTMDVKEVKLKGTLCQSPRRIDNFLKCWTSSFRLQANLFARKFCNHWNMMVWSSFKFWSSSTVPSKKFKDEALAAGRSATLSIEAITTLSTCLKARVTISWIQNDCIWGSFSASSTWFVQRTKNYSY